MKKYLIPLFLILSTSLSFAASNIDVTIPRVGNTTTAELRQNFQDAYTEITNLQEKTIGWINSADYTDINAAIAACTNTTLIIGEAETLTAALAVPYNCTLFFTQSGSITLGNYNLTFASQSNVIAGQHRIFIFNGSGRIVGPIQNELEAKWWAGGDQTDDTAELQILFTWIPNGTRLHFGKGMYRISDELTITNKDSITIYGDGMASGSGTMFLWNTVDDINQPTKAVLRLTRVSNSKFSNFYIGPASFVDSPGYGIILQSDGVGSASHNDFENILVQSLGGAAPVGIQVGNETADTDVTVDWNVFRHVYVDYFQDLTSAGTGFVVNQTNTNDTHFYDCVATGGKYGWEIAKVGHPRAIILDNFGASGQTDAYIYVHDNFASTLDINNSQLELRGIADEGCPILKTDPAASSFNADIIFRNIKASYDDDGSNPEFNIVEAYHNGHMSFENCVFAGWGDLALGTHTAAGNNATTLTDSARNGGAYPDRRNWTANALIGMTAKNITDSSSGIITANTTNTVTVAALVGGTDNDWDTNDEYEIITTTGELLYPSTNSAIIWTPLTSAQAWGLKQLSTKDTLLYDGAHFDINTSKKTPSANNPVRWLDSGSNYTGKSGMAIKNNSRFELKGMDIYKTNNHSRDASFNGWPSFGISGIESTALGLVSSDTFMVRVDRRAWTAAATTQDRIFITLPAMTRIRSIVAKTIQPYALAGAGTIVLKVHDVGTAAEFIADHDVKTSAVNTDVDQGGFISSYAGNMQIQATLTSDVNLGNGTATSLTTGITEIYIQTERLK